jgi:Major Facilitator Superfamily
MTGRDQDQPDRLALSIVMPTIAEEFALDPTTQRLLLSAFFWTYAALQVPGGWLIDRFGPRALVAGATVGWGFFQAIASVATGGISLAVSRIGLGVAEAPLFPAGAKLNSTWLRSQERGRGAMFVDCGAPLTTDTKMIARVGRAYRARAVRFGPVASEAAGVPAKAVTVGISPTSPGKIINTDSRIDHNKSRVVATRRQ